MKAETAYVTLVSGFLASAVVMSPSAVSTLILIVRSFSGPPSLSICNQVNCDRPEHAQDCLKHNHLCQCCLRLHAIYFLYTVIRWNWRDIMTFQLQPRLPLDLVEGSQNFFEDVERFQRRDWVRCACNSCTHKSQ